MATTQSRLTLQQFLTLPEEEPALEFFDGRVTQKAPPDRKHARLQAKMAELINRFAEPLQLAMAFTEMRAAFGDAAFVPDLSVYRWDRVPFNPDDELEGGIGDPPAIAVEIVSPDQSVTGLVEKCLTMVEQGTEIALLVDPSDRAILDIRPPGQIRALRGTDRIDLSSVLPGFELTVNDVFALLRRPRANRTAESGE